MFGWRVPIGGTDSTPSEVVSYLAGPWKRFFGYLIDTILVTAPMFVAGLVLGGRASPGTDEWDSVMETPEMMLALGATALIVGVQAILLVRRGQTLGKLALGTRIVTLENTQPAWWRLIFVRPAIPFVASLRPDQASHAPEGVWLRLVLSVLFLWDVIPVFERQRRAKHDLLAGTRVIDVRRWRESETA